MKAKRGQALPKLELMSDFDVDFRDNAVIGVVTAEVGGRSGLGVLDYLAPQGGCRAGDFVEVPLGPRRVPGVVWGAGLGQIAKEKLRRAVRVLDVPPMQAELRNFLARAADYTLTPLPAMLRLATRAPGLLDGAAARKVYQLGPNRPNQLSAARRKVIEALQTPDLAEGASQSEIAAAAKCSTSVVKGLIQLGVLIETQAPRDLPFPTLSLNHTVTLEGAQIPAAQALRKAITGSAYSCTLLKGVTGSGKTEVYLEAVAQCLAEGKQALVMLPEIALTADFLRRVEARFGARPAEWHSGMTLTQRRRLWRMVAQGGAQMVVGARSALFLPFQNLGLIVVDEEHDSSYKQEEGVLYHARDMAVLRGALQSCAVVLASATPSLESWANAQSGKYARLDLPARFGAAQLPIVRAVDMRSQPMPLGRWISEPLVREVRARLERDEQSLLFLNRRGYAPATLCRACGETIGCAQCDARMVAHKALGRLTCHQCGASKPIPQSCPSCGVEERLAAIGPGVERLAEEAASLFPDARLCVLSSDLFSSPHELKAQIARIAEGEADVIIGTQIVAKGHNFPRLTFVGVIDADLGLYGGDLRAAERTFALMRQVAGRAGRALGREGQALLQTHQPEHPVVRAIIGGDEEAFWKAEAEGRRAAHMPPFSRLAGIIISGPELRQTMEFAAALARHDAPLRQIDAQIYGPAPAPISRIRGRYRVRLLIKAAKTAPLQSALSAWSAQLKPPSKLRISIDIDPQSFL